jgi:ankyrin repeat protein
MFYQCKRASNGWTALTVAVEKSHIDVVNVLIAAGADVEAKAGREKVKTSLVHIQCGAHAFQNP